MSVYKAKKELVDEMMNMTKLYNTMKKFEFHLVQDKKDNLWYVVGVNPTGGWEFRTWWGYEEEIHAVNEFQSTFPFPVWDNIAMEDYPYPPVITNEQQNLRGDKQ